VVDLAGFMSPTVGTSRTEQAWSQARLVTFNLELELNCALVVESVMGLRRQDAFVRALASPAGVPDFFGQLLVDAEGISWQEINLRALSQSAEFLSICA